MSNTERRPVRIQHLDASVVHVERALIARAEALEEASRNTETGNAKFLFLAAEFRALAEELHWH